MSRSVSVELIFRDSGRWELIPMRYRGTIPDGIMEDIEMKNEMKNEQAVVLLSQPSYGSDRGFGWCSVRLGKQPSCRSARERYTQQLHRNRCNSRRFCSSDDTLMRITWQHAEDDLNWAFVVMKLTVGDNTFDCSLAQMKSAYRQDGSDDALWETGNS